MQWHFLWVSDFHQITLYYWTMCCWHIRGTLKNLQPSSEIHIFFQNAAVENRLSGICFTDLLSRPQKNNFSHFVFLLGFFFIFYLIFVICAIKREEKSLSDLNSLFIVSQAPPWRVTIVQMKNLCRMHIICIINSVHLSQLMKILIIS